MTSTPSWSVKGVDPEAREAAKLAARRSGQTLGQWLNTKIIETAEEEHVSRPPRHSPPRHTPSRPKADWRDPEAFDERVDYLEERLAALTRVQSDTALHSNYALARPAARDDQALQYVMDRLNRNEAETLRSFGSLNSRLDQLTEVVSQSHANAEHTRKKGGRDDDERYVALEKALNSVVSHLEQSETNVHEAIGELHARVGELANAGQRGASGTDQANHKIMGEIEQQLTALAHRVDRIGDKSVADAQAPGLEGRLAKLAKRIESAEEHANSSLTELHHSVEKRLGALAERVDAVSRRSQEAATEAARAAMKSARDEFREVEQQMRALAEHMHSTSSADADAEQAIAQLRDEVSGLSSDIDLIKHHAASEHDLQGVRDAIDNLAQSMEERFAAATNGGAFADLEARLADVSHELSSLKRTPPADPNMEVLERKVHEIDARLASVQNDDQREQILFAVEQQISGLAERIAASEQKAGDTQTLQQQITGLAKRLAASEQRFEGIQAIEKSIAQLFESIEHTRKHSGEAAERAVAKMAGQLRAQAPTDSAPADAVRAIEQGLAAVKASAAQSDQRTQETLEAVHDTLEKVVTRLIALEEQARAAPAPAPARMDEELPTIASTAAAASEAAPQPEPGTKSNWRAAIDAKSAQEMEEILAAAPLDEAGPMQLSATPDQRQGAAAPSMQGAPALDAGPSLGGGEETEGQQVNRRNDFIAAARRAAQAGSQEAPEEQGRSRFSLLRRGKKKQKETAEAAAGSLDDRKESRRPLILAAIVLLLIGAVSAYRFVDVTRGTDVSGLSVPPLLETSPPAATPVSTSEPQMLEMPPAAAETRADDASEIPPLEELSPRGDMEMLPPGPGTANADSTVEMLPLDGQANSTAVAQTPAADPITTGSVEPTAPAERGSRVAMDPMFGGGQQNGFSISEPSLEQADQVVERSAPEAPARQSQTTVTTATTPTELPPEGVGPLALRQAAAQGDPVAQFIVADAFTDGEGVTQDYRQAALWYQRAAARGLAPAQYRLATFYEKGRGVPQDLAAARIWYERAAEKGNRKAMHNLAVIYADGSRGEPNFSKAALWFRNAAELGLRDSQFNLAILHERGLGVEQDVREAYRWFALAAGQGDTDAQARLGVLEGRLTAEQLVEIKLEVETWQAQPMIEEANVVTAQDDRWTSRSAASPVRDQVTRELVLEAQTLLNVLGYETGRPDGIVGERTRSAIRTFEGANGLATTGAVTPALIETLRTQAGA